MKLLKTKVSVVGGVIDTQFDLTGFAAAYDNAVKCAE